MQLISQMEFNRMDFIEVSRARRLFIARCAAFFFFFSLKESRLIISSDTRSVRTSGLTARRQAAMFAEVNGKTKIKSNGSFQSSAAILAKGSAQTSRQNGKPGGVSLSANSLLSNWSRRRAVSTSAGEVST